MKAQRIPQGFWAVAVCVYMTAILISSLKTQIIPGEPTPWKEVLYNSAHVPAYAILTCLMWLSFGGVRLKTAGICAFVFGGLNEVIQMSVPGRMGSLSDLFLNALGIGLACAGVGLYLKNRSAAA